MSQPVVNNALVYVKQCPYCAEIIKAEALVCQFCDKDLIDKTPASPGNPQKAPFIAVLSISIFSFFGTILFMVGIHDTLSGFSGLIELLVGILSVGLGLILAQLYKTF